MLALGVVGAASVATFVARDQAAQAGLEQTLNVLGLLEQRSPGARNGAELTKHRRAAGPEQPFEHALGPAFPPEAVSDVTQGLGLASPEQLLAPAVPDTAGALAAAPTAGRGRTGGGYPTFIGGGGGRGRGNDFGGGGGGGAGGGGGDVPTDQLNPTQQSVPPAVPEPGTWATMLVGMGLCGFALRRRRRGAGGTASRCAVA